MFLYRVDIVLFAAEPNVHSGHILKPILLLFGDDKNSLEINCHFSFLLCVLRKNKYCKYDIGSVEFLDVYPFLLLVSCGKTGTFLQRIINNST
jgi:hypothetical protein